MEQEFIIFQKFSNSDSALELGKKLEENNIKFSIEDISLNFDPILYQNQLVKEFCVKIKQIDFAKAEKILSVVSESEFSSIDESYYLLSFSNEELIEVITKSDEWNRFDVSLAKKLLRDRGKEITEMEIQQIKQKRILELSKPEASQKNYIIVGYVIAFLGGFVGIFIGWHLLTYKKTLPNGNKVYAYSESDRKHGNRILIIGVLFAVLWILFSIFKK